MDKIIANIPQEKFVFAQLDSTIHDKKFDTKPRGYFADAMIRFRKNKSSVIAAFIIGFLILYAIVAPMLSLYSVYDQDATYTNYPPYYESEFFHKLGMFNGATVYESQNPTQLAKLDAIGQETGRQPLIKIIGEQEIVSIYRGQERITTAYKVRVNRYNALGIIYRVFSYEEFARIQKFQNETGLQVLYPYVFPEDIMGITSSPNLWYKVLDEKGTPAYDSAGKLIPAYSTDATRAGAEYNSLRIKGDNGSYIYSAAKSGSVHCRIDYYNYYQFINGFAPSYLFGTNSMGQDLFCAIGIGARFSLVFAILVSAINLTIGAFYGAAQGYYGGAVDLILDRIGDILYYTPMLVVVTLFQLHLAPRVGSVPAFLLAFVATGWIGMAALTRRQFYRFKGYEYVLSAKTLGAKDGRIMFKHIFPNSLGSIVTSCALVIPSVISSETQLTYLGIIDLSTLVGTSIGTLMSLGQLSMTTSPHAMLFPALFFSLLLISFNLFGNGLRDAFNPSMRGMED